MLDARRQAVAWQRMDWRRPSKLQLGIPAHKYHRNMDALRQAVARPIVADPSAESFPSCHFRENWLNALFTHQLHSFINWVHETSLDSAESAM
jgi:hypothetical protein